MKLKATQIELWRLSKYQHAKTNFIHTYIYVGGKDLNFYVGPQAPITNKSTSEEKKTFGKAL